MSDPFADYGARAVSSQPARLLGVNKTRADARQRYDEIVAELRSFQRPDSVAEYLEIIRSEIAQFRAELEFYWEGEGDFLGLRKEIALAQARVDAGLDLPRWETGPTDSTDLELFSHQGQGLDNE